ATGLRCACGARLDPPSLSIFLVLTRTWERQVKSQKGFTFPTTLPRVRMASQRRKRAIDLLCKHDTGQLMGKGHRRKREQQIGALAPSWRQSVRSADYEYQISRFSLRALHQRDKPGRIELLATRIETYAIARRRF